MEQQECSSIDGGNPCGTVTWEDSLIVSYKAKHNLTEQYSNLTPKVFTQMS